MRTKRETFVYIGLAIIIIEIMFLAWVHVMKAHAASIASLATAIDITETCPVEETEAVYHLEADAPTWNTLVNDPKLANVPSDAPEATETAPKVYEAITLTQEDKDLLARILWAEANSQKLEGQKACVEVVYNRILSPDWPGNLYDVLSQRGQFATWKSRNKVTPTQTQYDAIEAVLEETETVLPDTTYVYFDRRGVNGKNHIRIQDHVFGR